MADIFVTAENAYPDTPNTIQYLGGVAGSGGQNYIIAENVEVRCSQASYVGGIAGSGYVSYGIVRTAGKDETVSYQIPKTVVEGLEFAGGAAGTGGMGNGVVEGIQVTALRSNALPESMEAALEPVWRIGYRFGRLRQQEDFQEKDAQI